MFLASSSRLVSSPVPFAGGWRTVVDITRLAVLFFAFVEIFLFVWLTGHKKMRRNAAWCWAAASSATGAFVVGYTEFIRLGFPIGYWGRYFGMIAFTLFTGAFIYKSFRILGTKEGTLFEEFQRTRWSQPEYGPPEPPAPTRPEPGVTERAGTFPPVPSPRPSTGKRNYGRRIGDPSPPMPGYRGIGPR